jgi:hypothetical protein
MEVNGQLHAPVALPQGKSPCYPVDQRMSGSQSRSGRGGEEKNSGWSPKSRAGRGGEEKNSKLIHSPRSLRFMSVT